MKCPKCHRDTYSQKWDSCTAADCGPVAIVENPVAPKRKNPVVFHVKQHGITRRKDGICPRCDERPKGSSGYCPECHAARARERRAIHSSGRPSGRPRKTVPTVVG